MLKKWVKMFLEVKDIFVIVKSCGKSFVLKPKKIVYSEKFKKKAIKLYFECNSFYRSW